MMKFVIHNMKNINRKLGVIDYKFGDPLKEKLR